MMHTNIPPNAYADKSLYTLRLMGLVRVYILHWNSTWDSPLSSVTIIIAQKMLFVNNIFVTKVLDLQNIYD